MMRASISKSATAAGNSSGANTFRPPAQRPALAVRPAATSFRHDFSQMPIHAARQPRMLPDFPHAQKLESAFNRNIPGRAVIDEKGCEQRAVPAFTDRTTAHFASVNPPLRVAAHEAVHVLQHSGLSRDAHLGPERHADSVSRLIVKGASVRHLLSSEGAAVEPAIRLYTEIAEEDLPGRVVPEDERASDFRVSDDGKMAVAQQSLEKSYFADPNLIAASNRALESVDSQIRLLTGNDELTVPEKPDGGTDQTAPGGGRTRTLSRVSPSNLANGTQGPNMVAWADCGRCAGNVMGAGGGSGWGDPMTAKYQDVHLERPLPRPRNFPFAAPIGRAARAFDNRELVEVRKWRQTRVAMWQPQGMTDEIFSARLRGGQAEYQAMTEAQKESFDKETGINMYAEPGTGGGFTIARDPRSPRTGSDWPFHWAGVVTTSGHDRVTLENFADRTNAFAHNRAWFFQMYGPAHKPGQTFHEQAKATGSFGDDPYNDPTTLAVRKRNRWEI